jgi:hypothetical protein
MVMTAHRLATTLRDREIREGTGQQRKSAIQQKRELPEIIIQAKFFKGNAERPSHCRCEIIDPNCGYVDFHEEQRNRGE